MTKQQYRICKFISKNPNLLETTEKFNLDYLDLQHKLGVGALDFSDNKMDEKTKVYLTDQVIDEYENYHHKNVDSLITRIVAVWGGITGTIALAVQTVQAFL